MQSKWWQKDNRRLIGKYFREFRPYRKSNRTLVYRAAAGMIVTTLVSLTIPWVTMTSIDYVINTKAIDRLLPLLLFWVVAIVVRDGGGILSFYHLMIFRQRMSLWGRIKLLKHILNLPAGYFNDLNVGYVVCRVRDDVASLHPFWAGTLLTAIQSVVFIVVSAILLFRISSHLTMVMLVLSPLYLLPTFIFMKRIRDLSYETRELSGVAEGKLHESISGALTLKTLLLEGYALQGYFNRLKSPIRTAVKLEVLSNLKGTIGGILTSLVPIVISCYAGYLIYRRQLSVGEFIGFSVYVGFLLKPLANLFETNTQLQQGLAPLQRVFEILDLQPEVGFAPIPSHGAGRQISGDIQLRNINFSYDGKQLALAGVSLILKEGTVVGIAGISGAGKSTLVNLLVKLYAPQSGSITIGGVDYAQIPPAVIRRNIAIVSQDIFMFNDTVYENLVCQDRRLAKEDVWAAAKAAGAHDFILAMKDGYATVVGVRGLKLSGGQRARLSIARALLRNPRILIFDEATAFMDSQTEQLFREATRTLFHGRTVIIIAHRLASICDASKIYVFDRGCVIQEGTHQELSETPGLYQRLYHEQSRILSVNPTPSVSEARADQV